MEGTLMKLLVVEDELAFRQILKTELVNEGHEVVAVGTGAEALAELADKDFDVIVADLRLPDTDGIDIVRRTRESGNEIPVLVMTAYASVQTAVTALKAGATDYLIKPVRVPDMLRRVQQIYDLDRLRRENRLLRRLVEQETKSYWFADTRAGRAVKHLISKISGTNMTILIEGESGTGKGVTARLIHTASRRAEGPFVHINCAAIPETLIENELFGHAKGAFTGATGAQDGLVAAASGGTLFLDEISELALPMQAKLLHVIEEKTVRPLGSTRDRPVDVRIIAATNRQLGRFVDAGMFRQDLFFRLNTFRICLPSLREQLEVLPNAVEFFLAKHARRQSNRQVTLHRDVWPRFAAYAWPGNLRELENTIERALVLCDGAMITLADLPATLRGPEERGDASATTSLKERVRVFERMTIIRAIEAAGGDRRAAADDLGIGVSTLYRKLEEEVPEEPA
jgi:two-component system response regulator AtoC